MANPAFFGNNVTKDSAVQFSTRGGGIAFPGGCPGNVAVKITETINEIFLMKSRNKTELAKNILFDSKKVGKVKKAIIEAYPDCDKTEWPHDIAKLSKLGAALERVGAGKQTVGDINDIGACTYVLYEAFTGKENERHVLEGPSGIAREVKEIAKLLVRKKEKLSAVAEKTLAKGGLMMATLAEEGSLSAGEERKILEGGASQGEAQRAHTLIMALDSMQKLQEHFGL